jgi:periplasmic protein TonB
MAKRPPTDDDKTTPFLRDEPGATPALPPIAPAAFTAGPADAGAPIVPKQLVVGTSFKSAKAARAMPRWAMPLIGTVVFVHLAFIGGSWASSIWQIERLDRPKGAKFDIAVAPSPPPPPPPPPGGQKPQTEIKVKPKKTVKEIVQPVKIEKQNNPVPEVSGNPDGVIGGEEGGVADGVVGGDVTAPPPPPPPPPPPAPPQNVPPTLLEGQRIAGEKMIYPADTTKTEIQRSGKDRILGSFKLCLTVDGSIANVSQLKSTGFPAYDQRILSEMRNWRYRPYLVNGRGGAEGTPQKLGY